MYIIVEAITRYVDGYYTERKEALEQCRNLKHDFPRGRFFVAKVSFMAGDNIRLEGHAIDHYHTMLDKLGYKP